MSKNIVKAPFLSTCFSEKENDVRGRFINILTDKKKMSLCVACTIAVMTLTIGMFITLKDDKTYAISDGLNKVYEGNSMNLISGDEKEKNMVELKNEKHENIPELKSKTEENKTELNTEKEENIVELRSKDLEKDIKLNVVTNNPLKTKELHVTNAFGKRTHPVTGETIEHNGVDLLGAKGDKVYSISEGKVTKAQYEHDRGNYIEITNDKTITRYCHLSEILVKEGDEIKYSDEIGLVGSTGLSTGPHLHLEIFDKTTNEYVDPIRNN